MEEDLKMPLDEVRREIEEIDGRIIGCIYERIKLAEKVFEIKRRGNLAIEDEEQNKRVLKRAAEKASESGLDAEGVKDIFEVLIRMSIQHQKELMG
ncbi:MAG: chorismate mutase [Halobacteriota archaeon]|nr:chorismate mutase [Halobacteriota archaeon]